MRSSNKLFATLSFVIISILLFNSCIKDKETLPVIATTEVTDITQTTAASGGAVTNDGGALIDERGVCWSNAQNPTTSDSKTTDGAGIGDFSSFLTGLTPGATYYVKAYATNSVGIGYGSQISFSTSPILAPTMSTAIASSITSNEATSGGIVTGDGGGSITERGVCWNTTQNPTYSNNKTSDGNGLGQFTSSLTGLSPNTTYYLRAYAVNSAGIAYGNEIIFTTNTETLGCENVWMTSGIYPETGDLIYAVQQEFGNDYTIADWSDLRAILNVDAWISCMGLKEDQMFWLTTYGNHYYSGTRHYFVRYSSDGVPNTFLVHDQVANKLFLGSWYGFNFNILAKKSK